MFNRSNVSIAHKDLAMMEQLYARSDLDWMAVKPVLSYGLRSTITRGEVARLMLDAVEQTGPFTNHTPMFAG
jgi:hypothetical protein